MPVLAKNDLHDHTIKPRIQLFVTKPLRPEGDTSPGSCFLFSLFPLSFYPDFLSPAGPHVGQLQRVWRLPSPFPPSLLLRVVESHLRGAGTLLRASRVHSATGRQGGPIIHLHATNCPLISHEELSRQPRPLRHNCEVNHEMEPLAARPGGSNPPRARPALCTENEWSLGLVSCFRPDTGQDVFKCKEVHFCANRLRSKKFSSAQGNTSIIMVFELVIYKDYGSLHFTVGKGEGTCLMDPIAMA